MNDVNLSGAGYRNWQPLGSFKSGSQIQTHQSINGFLGWLNDVNQVSRS